MDNRKDEKILAARIADQIGACENKYMITYTEFMDLHQRSLAESVIRDTGFRRYGFYGGYSEAERTIAVFLPEYIGTDSPEDYFRANPEDDPLTLIRFTHGKVGKELTHRDYLGALMGLGIRRDVTGDILVNSKGADAIVLHSIADFIEMNMTSAGRSSLSAVQTGIPDLVVPEQHFEERNVSVASLRLDNLLSAAFSISRSSAAEAVRSGLVFVDGIEMSKPDHQIDAGARIVLRHKGKAILSEIGRMTSKNRIHVTIVRYR